MENKLYRYLLYSKYGCDTNTLESIYFLTAKSKEDAEKKLSKVLDHGFQFYNVRECQFDELPEILSKLPR